MRKALFLSLVVLLLLTACDLLSSVLTELLPQPQVDRSAFETAVNLALATAIIETQQAQVPPVATVPPGLMMSQVLRSAQSEIEQMIAIAVATAVAERIDIPVAVLPTRGGLPTLTPTEATTPEEMQASATPTLAMPPTATPESNILPSSPAQKPRACLAPNATWFGAPVDAINTREGPAAAYPSVAYLKRPDCLELRGRNASSTWVYGMICHPQPDGTCRLSDTAAWAAMSLLTIHGGIDNLRVIMSSPPPLPPTATITPTTTGVVDPPQS